MGSLAILYLRTFARDGRFPAGPYFLLLAVPGFLYIASALSDRMRGARADGMAR